MMAEATFTGEGTDEWNDTDAQAKCSTSWNSGTVAWTVPVSGRYEKLADGSLSVSFIVSEHGPTYKRPNIRCQIR